MAIEDKLWKVYCFGTKEEIEKFRANNVKYNGWGDDATFNKAIKRQLYVGGPLCISLGLLTVVAPICWITDTVIRGTSSETLRPGLVGTVRELYQKHKK